MGSCKLLTKCTPQHLPCSMCCSYSRPLHKSYVYASCKTASFACKLPVPLQRGAAACLVPHVHNSCFSHGQQMMWQWVARWGQTL